MNFTDLFRFAWSALSGHRLRTILSTLGVAIGVSSVVLLVALGEGARVYVTAELASLGSDLIVVLPGKVETSGTEAFVGGVTHDLTLADAKALQQRVGVIQRLAPGIVGQTSVSHGSLSRNVTIIGTTSEFGELHHVEISSGSFLPPGEMERGSNVVVIGTKVQQELFRGMNPLGKVLRIGDWRFRIVGVMAPKGQHMGFNYDDLCLIPVATAMSLFNQTTLFRLFIETNAYADLGTAKKQIIDVMKERHNNHEDITLLTQDSLLASFNKIFGALTLALAGIAAISLTVAGVGIMNVMLVSVSERTSEIGLLKAIGVTGSQIISVFLAEALLLCLIGGILGFLSAIFLVDLSLKVFPVLPATIQPWSVLAALVVAAAVGLGFGVWPARRASRLDPIAALTRR